MDNSIVEKKKTMYYFEFDEIILDETKNKKENTGDRRIHNEKN